MILHRRDLWKLIKENHIAGNAAEIGVAEGYFSADILSWPVDFEIVYMVDRWAHMPGQKGDGGHPQEWHDANFKAAKDRVARFGQRAQMIPGSSHLAALRVPNQSLALCYIDADHSYEGVMRDIASWHSKVVKGGIMAFHDYEAPQYGVKKAVQDFCLKTGYTIHLLPEDKKDDAGAFFYVD